MRKKIFIALGTVALALGIVGIFVPLLPTTPFLLLAAACYARGSKRFYNWLINHKHLGAYIRNYRAGKGLTLATKISTLLLLWLSIGFSVWRIDQLWVEVILLVIAIGVTIHLLSLPTLTKEASEKPPQKTTSPSACAQGDDST